MKKGPYAKLGRLKNHESRAPARSRGRMGRTKAERLFADALTAAGEPFKFNYTVRSAESFSGYYLVDFYLPARKLLVEVDGSVHRGEAAQWKDKLRTEAIGRALPGRSLVRVWNAEVEADPAAVVARLTGP